MNWWEFLEFTGCVLHVRKPFSFFVCLGERNTLELDKLELETNNSNGVERQTSIRPKKYPYLRVADMF